jgi:hypothetical protein
MYRVRPQVHVPSVIPIIAEKPLSFGWRVLCSKCAMSELSTLIRRVTEDLHSIQTELGEAAQSRADKAMRDQVMQQLVDANLVNEFKTAVDHMRVMLWSYIEAASAKKDVAETLQSVRMQRVTEMLKVLDVEDVKTSKAPEAESFLDLINSIAATALDRHGKSQNAAR